MKAVCWMGTSKVETLTVADPTLLNPHDAIIKITKTAICGPKPPSVDLTCICTMALSRRWKPVMSLDMNSWASSKRLAKTSPTFVAVTG
jgi:Alcohol dehydrogenase GroES-associated